MAKKQLHQLPAGGPLAGDDLLLFRDVSDTTGGADGTDKKLTAGIFSRQVMETASSTANYYAKLKSWTVSLTAVNHINDVFLISTLPGAPKTDLLFLVNVRTDATGTLDTANSLVDIVSLSGDHFAHNSVFIVQPAAGTIELWVQGTTGGFVAYLQEISSQFNGTTETVNDGAAWQVSAPAGTTITSDWAGSGQLSSISLLNGWAGTIYYEKFANGLLIGYLEATTIGTTADGTTIFTLPPGYRPGIGLIFDAHGNDAAYASAAGRLSITTAGVVAPYGYAGTNTIYRANFLFEARN